MAHLDPDHPETWPLSIYVYEVPVRLWHWAQAASVFALCVTGYLIAVPLPTISGEASQYYLMGYIRFVHFAAGYVFGIGLLFRFYWAFAGNIYARELFYLPIWSRRWSTQFWRQVAWTLFLRREPEKFPGHNPVARMALFVFYLLPALFLSLTGFAMYAEAGPKDALMFRAFSWMIALFPNTQDLHTWHHAGMWVLVSFMIMHVYITIREDIMSRQSLMSTMISGFRMFKDRES